MNVQAQIRKYKGLVDILAEELQALMESLELLRPIAEDPELLKRFQANESFRVYSPFAEIWCVTVC
jgi:hypothetical protein